jgi:hypothetical protein
MGLLGNVVGGALQGLGQGINNQVIAAREQALEAMRQQRQVALQDRQFANQRELAGVQHDYKLEENDQEYRNKGGLLAIGTKAKMAEDDHALQNDLSKIKAEQVGRKELAVLESRLSAGRTEAELKLRDSLGTGDISSVVRGKDGQYYGLTKGGLVPTGVQADPTSSETRSNGGGDLTESEQENAYGDALTAWRTKGGDPKTRPNKSDFIGLTREQYRASKGGASAAPSPAAPAASAPAPSPQTTARMTKALTQLAGIYASATPEKYPGLFRNGRKIPMEEARQTVMNAIGG